MMKRHIKVILLSLIFVVKSGATGWKFFGENPEYLAKIAQQAEEARKKAARQEAARQEAARQKAARQEAARQKVVLAAQKRLMQPFSPCSLPKTWLR